MSSPIPALESHTVTLRRYLEGEWVDGVYENGPVTESTITGSLQPLRPNEMQLLPEGRRTSQAMKLYTTDEIRTANEETNMQADEVEVDELIFEVFSVEKWTLPGSDNAHYKSILLKKNDEGGTK